VIRDQKNQWQIPQRSTPPISIPATNTNLRDLSENYHNTDATYKYRHTGATTINELNFEK